MRDLALRLEDRPGALAEAGEALGKAGVSIEGGGAFRADGSGLAHFLVADAAAARRALEGTGIEVLADREVLVQRLDQARPGQLGRICRRMADAGVNIEVLYSDHENRLILVVDDLERGRRVSDAWRREHAAFSVRKATPIDTQGLLECLAAAFEPYRESYTEEGFNDTVMSAETIGKRLADMCLFVAAGPDGRIVGTIGCKVVDGERGHIRGMAVRPEGQGSGVAAALLEAVQTELQERGCSRVTLNTTAPLRRATRFYERNGFRPTGVVRDFFGMPLFEYVKALPAASGR